MPRLLAALLSLLLVACGGSSSPDGAEAGKQEAEAKKAEAKKADAADDDGTLPRDDWGYTAAGIAKKKRPKITAMSAEQVAAIGADPADGELSLVFVGDTLNGPGNEELVAEHGQRYSLEATAPLLQPADLVVANLEGALVATKERPTKWSQRSDPEFAEAMAWAGIDVVTLGNNHLANYGDEGTLETLRHLEAAGIGAFGVGPDPAAARAPWVGEVGGLKVALLGGLADSIFLDPDWLEDPRKIARRHAQLIRAFTHRGGRIQQATWLHTPETLAEDVRKAKEVADLVVVNLHMGVILYRPPYQDQVALARAAAEAGADLVIGHHAHLWQPVGLVEGVPVVYGLGNFAMGYRGKLHPESMVARAIVDADAKRITRVELFPVETSNVLGGVDYRTPLLAGDSATAMLQDLATWSDELCDTKLEVRADRAILHVPEGASAP